jgi:putative phosphoesterase
MLTVGVISDTHGLLRPDALEALRGSDHIIHAGDIGSAEILAELEKIAPVHAIRGNVDVEPWAEKLPSTVTVELEGLKVFVIHNRAELKKAPPGVAAVIFGHSHQPVIENRGEMLYFNPGSAGPRRFKLPITVGRIRFDQGKIHPELVPLLP